MFTPLTLVRNKTQGSWSICLYHKDSKRRYWLDISLDETYQELSVEWNQYIFYLTDCDDVARKEFQEDCDNFEAALEACYAVLEEHGEVFLGEDGDYYLKNEWKGAETWNL